MRDVTDTWLPYDLCDPVSVLRSLIPIRSQNGIDTEHAMSVFLSRVLALLGFSVETVSFVESRPNILGNWDGEMPGSRILFNAHMDTKPAYTSEASKVQWQTDPFTPVEKDGCLYGLGACDTKGGIAALVAALARWRKRRDGNHQGSVAVHFVCDEEMDSEYGTKRLCLTDRVKADFAIVLEPTGGRVTDRQLGNLFLKTDFWTPGGHTGVPQGKMNAFGVAIDFIKWLERWAASLRQASGISGQPFINIGRFEGGTSSGTIPGYCQLLWGVRILPGHDMADYIEQICNISDNFSRTLTLPARCATSLFGNGGLDSCVCQHSNLLELINLSGYESTLFPGGTDAALIYRLCGIPTCVLGPGRLEQAHAPNEYCSIEELEAVADLIARYLLQRDSRIQ